MEDEKQTEVIDTPVEESFDSKADAFLDSVETDTPEDSSPETKPEETEPTETKEPSAEDEKTESSEEKVEDVPKEFHKNPAWQRILKERDEARQKLTEAQSSIPKDDIEKFNKVVSSPEFIRSSMKAEGYTTEAINKRLQELGHQVETPSQDMVQKVLTKLNVDYTKLDEQGKQYIDTHITDTVNVARIIAQEVMETALNEKMQPLQEELGQLSQAKFGENLANKMQEQVKTEDLLDFKQEVEPTLLKWMNDNPKANQNEVYDYFKELNHTLTIQKLKVKGNKDARDEKKGNLRNNAEGTINLQDLKLSKTGSFDEKADAFLDAYGVN